MDRKYDVIVIGGGTAGVIAAIAAARNGARTLIVEKNSYLGGVAAMGIPFLGIYDGRDRRVNAGIPQELIERMCREGGCLNGVFGTTWMDPDYHFSITPYDQECYKYVAQEMVLEAGADILFHTVVSDLCKKDGLIESIELVNKSGKNRYRARIYIDTTGDADVAYLAGVPMVEKQEKQNASMLFSLIDVDVERVYHSLQNGEGISGWKQWHNRILTGPKLDSSEPGVIHMAGHFDGPDGKPVTFTAISIRKNQLDINATRTVGIDGTNADDLSRAEVLERRHVHELVAQLKAHVPGMEHARLMYTAPIGIRESRNIIGDYQLQKEDVLQGRQFPDSVVRGAYPIDIHDPKGGRTQFQFIRDGGSYSIPYGCFLPRSIENLLVAGRCLSATPEALGTARIMGVVMGQGQAVGTAAALATRSNVSLRALDIKQLQSQLLADGAML